MSRLSELERAFDNVVEELQQWKDVAMGPSKSARLKKHMQNSVAAMEAVQAASDIEAKERESLIWGITQLQTVRYPHPSEPEELKQKYNQYQEQLEDINREREARGIIPVNESLENFKTNTFQDYKESKK